MNREKNRKRSEDMKTDNTKTDYTKADELMTETETEDANGGKEDITETGMPGPEADDEDSGSRDCSPEELLAEKTAELEKLKKELEDSVLRQRADLENYRKRLIREKEEAVLFANTSLIGELLQFLDNLDRVIAAAKTGGDIKAFSDGVEMIRDQLLSALGKNWGLEKIAPEGESEFLPEEHEACMAEIVPGLEGEKVLQVLQPGYRLHSRVLRPAKVKIGKPE